MAVDERLIHIPEGSIEMEGLLKIPQNPSGIVLFAHGSGSGRFSPRNNYVADVLNNAGLATLLVDLLTKEEDLEYSTRFNIPLLTQRLHAAAVWLGKDRSTKGLPLGLFGASTGAAAALELAAKMKKEVKAVVSRGGRPDMAMEVLGSVAAPTLLIVGGNDFGVIELNISAYKALGSVKELQIVPGATHLFEEPGCLEEVARLAQEWFKKMQKN
jgi:putative phosphoribosyl transferase